MSLGENIRKLRKDKGYSIMKVRELTGLSKSTISDIENDKSSPTSETMAKLATALGCTVSNFFDEPVKVLSSITDADSLFAGSGSFKDKIDTAELSKKAEKDIQKSLNQTLDMIENSQDGLMFDGEPLELDDLTRELLKQSLENSMRMAKKIAKEKYTPKKYKK